MVNNWYRLSLSRPTSHTLGLAFCFLFRSSLPDDSGTTGNLGASFDVTSQ